MTANQPPQPEPLEAPDVEATHSGAQGDAQVNDQVSAASTENAEQSQPSFSALATDHDRSAASPASGVEGADVGSAVEAATDASEMEPAAPEPAAMEEPWLRGSSPRRLRLIDKRLQIALGLQGVIAAVVLGLWLLAKLSWNHDPLVSQKFRPLELPALTNRAQNAALEFHHDLVTGEFGQARLLVVEEAEKLVDEAAAACRPEAPCASKERVFTRATLMSSVGQAARALVESFAADGRAVGQATYELSHASGRWLVTARVAP